jgi:hypothetical protein
VNSPIITCVKFALCCHLFCFSPNQERIDALESAAAAFDSERADMIAQTKQYVASMRQASADKTKEMVQKVMNRVYVDLDKAVRAAVAAKQGDAAGLGHVVR